MDQNKNNQSRLTRREFLQSAALGIATVNFFPTSRKIQEGFVEEEIEIIGGTLSAFGDGWLEVHSTDGIRRVKTGVNTVIWKGGETSPDNLRKGDDILIRALVQEDLAVRVWSNLTRIQGIVNSVSTKGYVLHRSGFHAPHEEIFLHVDERSLVGNPMTDIVPTRRDLKGRDKKLISVNDYVDVIGEQKSDGVFGTTVILYPDKISTSISTEQSDIQIEDEIEVNPTGTCTATYTGHSVWFNCSTGAGGCKSCDTSKSNQCAWPAMKSCGSCSTSCCDCSKGCKNQRYLSCGNSVYVIDACYSKTRTVYIADCGPCQNCSCSTCCSGGAGTRCCQVCGVPDCYNRKTPIIDLTKPTFAYFRDPNAGWGCFSCSVRVTYTC